MPEKLNETKWHVRGALGGKPTTEQPLRSVATKDCTTIPAKREKLAEAPVGMPESKRLEISNTFFSGRKWIGASEWGRANVQNNSNS